VKFVALVDFVGGRGMMLEVKAKDKHDLAALMGFVEIVQTSSKHTDNTIESVTFVNPVTKKPATPYIHPAMADGFGPDQSIQLGGKKWLELVLSVSLGQEEE